MVESQYTVREAVRLGTRNERQENAAVRRLYTYLNGEYDGPEWLQRDMKRGHIKIVNDGHTKYHVAPASAFRIGQWVEAEYGQEPEDEVEAQVLDSPAPEQEDMAVPDPSDSVTVTADPDSEWVPYEPQLPAFGESTITAAAEDQRVAAVVVELCAECGIRPVFNGLTIDIWKSLLKLADELEV